MYDAEVNRCLSFEQVSDEVIEYYKIENGNFDTISECKYSVPSYLDIGKLYSIMVEDCSDSGQELDVLIKIFDSLISDEISDFYFTLDYSDGYDYISFECTKLNNGNFQIDTEDSVVNKIIINGNTEADYIKKKDRHMLVWQDDENYYILFIDDIETSRMEDKYNELIKIAESVR